MSYTNSTTHYHIPLPTQTDLVNGLDWNDSSEAIDTAVYEASQAASTAAGDIVTIKQDIVDLKAEDVLIEQAATELTGRVGTLEQNATLDEQAIQDVADMITDKEVSQAQSDVHVDVGEWFRYNGVLYVCTVEINIGDTIIPNTNCRATNIEDEMPSGGSIDADDVGYDNTTSGLTADDVQEAIDELSGNLTANSQKFRYGYDSATQKYGYIIESGGADTFVPFSGSEYVISQSSTLTQKSVGNTASVPDFGSDTGTSTGTFTTDKTGVYVVDSTGTYTSVTYNYTGSTGNIYSSGGMCYAEAGTTLVFSAVARNEGTGGSVTAKLSYVEPVA